MPEITKLCLFPIKSLDRVEVEQAQLLAGGALMHDREFAIVDGQDKFVHAKRTEKVHLLRSHFDLSTRTITLQASDIPPVTFHVDHGRAALAAWFSQYFGYPVTLKQNLHMGFPDDKVASGPTLVSVASLEAIATWFDLSLEEVRQRFRANIEIDGVPAFWEDQLFGEPGQPRSFQIGDVRFLGINPCARCVVPTRNPWTGDRISDFQQQFVAKRQATLPVWANSKQFNHFYRLTVNTQVPVTEAGKVLTIGDELKID
jgi:hypothetical protein